ncbi:hypothetical protein [Pedobacter cryophilus]|uniref:Uncharacterized protein n=1 Tax=Pedobacter cryophilus TaxID=2571271 RepID=A0A4U1BX07_9SPHI|nr:hypothetical protein [Pedobacter cryophilus]TKB96861.1 hypothetical protein FA046_12345 [Pedobacter cryophilus]
MEGQEEKTELQGTEETIFTPIIDENVLINRENLKALIQQNADLKNEVGQLVGVFKTFSGLFSGKINMLKLPGIIMSLTKDEKTLDQFKHVLPIIEKYAPDGKD